MGEPRPTFALIARWRYGKSPSGNPDNVFWDDGTPASLEEYCAHQFDTHECVVGIKGGVEVRIYPEIIADVHFDTTANSWLVEGPGVPSASLNESDPNTSDEMLIAALCRLPVAYRARVHRDFENLGCTYFLEPKRTKGEL